MRGLIYKDISIFFKSIDKKLTTGAVIPIAEEKKEIEATTVLL